MNFYYIKEYIDGYETQRVQVLKEKYIKLASKESLGDESINRSNLSSFSGNSISGRVDYIDDNDVISICKCDMCNHQTEHVVSTGETHVPIQYET